MFEELKLIAQQLEGQGIVKMIEVQKLSLQPDELLMVRFPSGTTPAVMKKFGAVLGVILGPEKSRQVMLTTNGIEFTIIEMKQVAPGGNTNGSP